MPAIVGAPQPATVGLSSSRGGWLLPALIVLLTIVSVTLLSATMLLGEHLRTISLRRHQVKAIALAQAGIMRAIYDFRFNAGGNGFVLGEYPVPADTGVIGSYTDDDVFILGGEPADFLLANFIPATLATAGAGGACGSASRHRVQDWNLRNVLLTADTTPTAPDGLPDGMPLRITQIVVTWDNPQPGEGPIRLDLQGTGADWTAPACAPVASGAAIPIPLGQQTINPDTQWGTNRLWFATPVMHTKAWIQLDFTVSNGSSSSIRRARYIPSVPPVFPSGSSGSFTIKSVGEVRRGGLPFVAWRRLQVEYRLNDDDASVSLQDIGNITSDPSPEAGRPGYHELTWKTP